jgi:hypothetical protein
MPLSAKNSRPLIKGEDAPKTKIKASSIYSIFIIQQKNTNLKPFCVS